MFNKDKIQELLDKKGWTKYRLAKESNLGQSTIHEIMSGKKKSPTSNTLHKIATALGVSIEYFFDNSTQENIIPTALPETFDSPQQAMEFILSQPTIMGYGGFDINKMNEEEIINFANELLSLIKIIAPKYNKN